MSKYKVIEVLDKSIWETFLLSRKPGTFLQSWNWGESNRLSGFNIKRLGFYQSENLVGVAQLIHQPAKRGPHYLVPGGPVIDYDNKELVAFTFSTIKNIAKKDNVWFVRIRPDVSDSENLRNQLKNVGLIYAPMHLHGEHTLILNITKGEEEILKNMRKTTRYLIKRSLNEEFKIRLSKNPKDTKILEKLQKITVKRHHFVGFTKKLFEAQIETFGKDGQAELFICEKKGNQIVAAIIIYYGEKAFYHHSGSSEESRNTNASYFTQWQIIKRAKKLGKKYYDFWGIAPTDDPKHRFAGVTTFKKGFGGERIDWVHAHDMPISSLYWTTYLFETGRRLIRRL
ncbi:hypothetical protein A2714_00510 [Candidatus Woesebacteria bacterium RIFCSPHIGHO2_01_FULL_38_9]|uniref:BioF2-like acetyltransferase domain-containing protein n=2 Tax=Candidatus Woeseibacteriota TaxID=1752722 RepID=A0A1F7Y2H8_9BACT|nr:MAG: hypothetical protein A2714_00510 [Candidatus Woesebacteria bacterium RIFCSPHIGHO2_01_FULL_38_9]OGM58315.1 MAG: hypothetical protein A3A75_04775 [Candidatus Woesebacteria bacterium RIFCSPLOWO2_01_FULL_39_10]